VSVSPIGLSLQRSIPVHPGIFLLLPSPPKALTPCTVGQVQFITHACDHVTSPFTSSFSFVMVLQAIVSPVSRRSCDANHPKFPASSSRPTGRRSRMSGRFAAERRPSMANALPAGAHLPAVSQLAHIGRAHRLPHEGSPCPTFWGFARTASRETCSGSPSASRGRSACAAIA